MKPLLRLGAIAIALLGCGAQPHNEPARIAEDAVVIDVRTRAEYNAGHIEGAVLMPHDLIGERIAAAVPDTSRQIVVYCRTGRRSAIAQRVLREMGYADVVNAGGLAEARQRLAQ